MKINLTKTKAMVICRSLTHHPTYSDFIIDDTALDNVVELRTLGLDLDSKLTFEGHKAAIITSAVQKVGILRLAWYTVYIVTLT